MILIEKKALKKTTLLCNIKLYQLALTELFCQCLCFLCRINQQEAPAVTYTLLSGGIIQNRCI